MNPILASILVILVMVVMIISAANAEMSYLNGRYERAKGYALIFLGSSLMIPDICLAAQ